jgi:hypothetical protein
VDVPFVRFTRDKRGYEHVYLVHTPVRSGRPGKPQVLYWYRSPPGLRVGREAFDATVRRALEAQYPDLTFDWDALSAPPPPQTIPSNEKWRDRRRLRKAQRPSTLAEEVEIETESPTDEMPIDDVEPLEADLDLIAASMPDENSGDSAFGEETAEEKAPEAEPGEDPLKSDQ